MKVGDSRETKKRSLVKTLAWRVIAILNSFTVLILNLTNDALENALIMNLTGFIVYYGYERLCNTISWGVDNASR